MRHAHRCQGNCMVVMVVGAKLEAFGGDVKMDHRAVRGGRRSIDSPWRVGPWSKDHAHCFGRCPSSFVGIQSTIARPGNPDYLRRTLVSMQHHGFPIDAVYVMHPPTMPRTRSLNRCGRTCVFTLLKTPKKRPCV